MIHGFFEESYGDPCGDLKGPPLQPLFEEAFNEWSTGDKSSLTFDVHCTLGTINKMCALGDSLCG